MHLTCGILFEVMWNAFWNIKMHYWIVKCFWKWICICICFSKCILLHLLHSICKIMCEGFTVTPFIVAPCPMRRGFDNIYMRLHEILITPFKAYFVHIFYQDLPIKMVLCTEFDYFFKSARYFLFQYFFLLGLQPAILFHNIYLYCGAELLLLLRRALCCMLVWLFYLFKNSFSMRASPFYPAGLGPVV